MRERDGLTVEPEWPEGELWTWEPRPAIELVLAAARSVCDREALGQVEAAAADADWDEALGLAQEHRLDPIVHWALEQAGVEPELGGEPRERLAKRYHSLVARTVVLADRCRALLQALDHAGVPAMCLKGLALAEACYPDLALRITTDFDLLVRREQIAQTGDVLKGLGYVVTSGPRGESLYGSPRDARGQMWAHNVEVQHEILTGGYGHRKATRFGAADLWDGATKEVILGAPAWKPPVERELLFLCAHLSLHHGVFQLMWLLDLAALARSAPMDWERFQQACRDCGLCRAAWAALALASRCLEDGLDPERRLLRPTVAALRPEPAVMRSLTRAVGLATLIPVRGRPIRWRMALGRRVFLDTRRDRMAYVARSALGWLADRLHL